MEWTNLKSRAEFTLRRRGLYCRDERSTGVSRSRTSVTVLKVRPRDFIYFILDHTLTESQATAHAAYQKNHLTFANMRFDSDGHELTVVDCSTIHSRYTDRR